jgi:hypothetical protein
MQGMWLRIIFLTFDGSCKLFKNQSTGGVVKQTDLIVREFLSIINGVYLFSCRNDNVVLQRVSKTCFHMFRTFEIMKI